MGNKQASAAGAAAVPGSRPAREIAHRRNVKAVYHLHKDVLGEGAFSTVRLGKSRASQRQVAIKTIKKDTGEGKTEIEVLEFLGAHDNIMKMLGAYSMGKQVWIVLELCDGGDIIEYFQRIPPTESHVSIAFRGLLQALEFCHARNIAHRDVKPDNVLMCTDGSLNCRLCDFGSAVHFRDSMDFHDETVGTACYVAPEVVRKCYQPAIADMWSAGMTLFCIFTEGMTPFDGPYEELTFHRILTDRLVLPPQITKKWSSSAQHFLMSLLRRQLDRRLSAKQALAHPWIAEQGLCVSDMVVPESEDPARCVVAAV